MGRSLKCIHACSSTELTVNTSQNMAEQSVVQAITNSLNEQHGVFVSSEKQPGYSVVPGSGDTGRAVGGSKQIHFFDGTSRIPTLTPVADGVFLQVDEAFVGAESLGVTRKGSPAGVPNDSVGGRAIIQTGNTALGRASQFHFTPVPEPETYAMIAGLALIGFGLWRRSQSR